MRIRGRWIAALVWLGLTVLPRYASAQSAITGQVKDTTGAAVPGVTVEASSDALIEKARTVVSDGQGQFTIVDLRPGAYVVKFSLEGFQTIVREGIDLPSNFTATVNAELKVGALEESVTVSGQSPTVDVRSASTTQVLSRALVDAVPTAHDFRGLGATIPGVKPSIQNVGGTRALSPQILTVRGSDSRDTATMVDGLIMNSMMGDDNIHLYHNDALVQEINYQTSAIPAESSKGGVIINIIPRDGGNTFHGQGYWNYANHSWQANNLTSALVAKGLTSQNRNGGLYDLNPWVGGPVVKNKLWFISSYRDVYVKEIVANTFYPDRSPGYQLSHTRNASTRFTLQATSNNKISIHADKQFKRLPNILTSGQDPLSGGVQRYPRDYLAAVVKWTYARGNRLLFDTGWGTNHETYFSTYANGIEQVRGTPEWYANATHSDTTLGTRWKAGTQITGDYPKNGIFQHALSYVTGSHNLKTGAQWRYGTYKHTDDGNGDLEQVYLNGVPDTVTVRNTPTNQEEHWDADLGIFGQDSWVFKRMTLNLGLRWEFFKASIPENTAPAGRFVGARDFAPRENLPNWKNWSPRFGLVYDVFGNGKTAVKVSANRYNQGQALSFARRYNPMALATDSRIWRDCAFTPGTTTCEPSLIGAPGYHDDIAQDNEIGPSNNLLLGQAITRRPDPGIKREFNTEYSTVLQHQLFQGLGLQGGWYRRQYYNKIKTFNELVNAASDYTSFQIANPLGTGENITVYNLNRNKQGLVSQVDSNSNINSTVYNGFEISFTARLNQLNLYGGWTGSRVVQVTCDTDAPNSYRFCDQRGQLRQSEGATLPIPFRHDFKLNGFYRFPRQIEASFAWQNYAGAASTINYSVPAAAFSVVGGRTQAVSVPLVAPGVRYLERWNQLDVGIRKAVSLQKPFELTLSLDVFNILNASSILGEIQTFGPNLGRPTEILQGRFARVAAALRF